ncbi:MAG: MFS transporter [Alistipes sp.]|jgi:FHS family L-fucose permease-like MFS transporter|nr:MFS transporter [Alistipes sp.]
MTTTQQKQGNVVGIISMIFLFGMIAFVTNLATPIGVIWKNQVADSTFLGFLGNAMNFIAYLLIGIPAGKLLTKIGYKKTALTAIAVGLIGIFVQFLSSKAGDAGFYVYLAGAFIAGMCVCMLNTVVNPMLNTLAGGGNKGNQLIQTGGAFNSLLATITPIMVGAMIGEAAKAAISDVNPLLFIAMGVFALTFVILAFVPLKEIHKTDNVVYERSPWAFRHFVLGALAIFTYVGVEVGIPGMMIFWLSDSTAAGAGLPVETAVATGMAIAATYWFLMMVGRFVGGAIGGKVSSRAMMAAATGIATVLVLAAMFTPSTVQVSMPAFTGSSFIITQAPLSAMLLVLCGLCTSVLWGAIFNLATEGLGKYTPLASGIFMVGVCGGGILPLIQGWLADNAGYMTSYWVVVAGILYMLFYALVGSKNVNKDIKVD